MSKTYEIQGQKFELKDEILDVLNAAAPLIVELRKIEFKYKKDIDFSPLDTYKDKFKEFSTMQVQIENILNLVTDKKGIVLSEEQKKTYVLSDEDKKDYENRLETAKANVLQIENEFKSDLIAQNLTSLRDELDNMAMITLISSKKLVTPILKSILYGGDIDKLDFKDKSIVAFISEVIKDFFAFTKFNS